MKICHASLDENKKISGGQLGDQTGTEVCIRSWYSKPWSIMLRYKDSAIAALAAQIAMKLAESNLVGYDQSNRNSLYQALKKYNWDVDAYIKSGENTETDCSAFVYACYCCVIPEMRNDSNAPTTSMIPKIFPIYGFIEYFDSEYLDSSDKLQAGDLINKPGSHVAMAINDAGAGISSPVVSNKPKVQDKVPQAAPAHSIVTVTANLLNIRKEPNANSIITGLARKQENYEIVEVKNGWGKLSNGKGWFNLKYTKYI